MAARPPRRSGSATRPTCCSRAFVTCLRCPTRSRPRRRRSRRPRRSRRCCSRSRSSSRAEPAAADRAGDRTGGSASRSPATAARSGRRRRADPVPLTRSRTCLSRFPRMFLSRRRPSPPSRSRHRRPHSSPPRDGTVRWWAATGSSMTFGPASNGSPPSGEPPAWWSPANPASARPGSLPSSPGRSRTCDTARSPARRPTSVAPAGRWPISSRPSRGSMPLHRPADVRDRLAELFDGHADADRILPELRAILALDGAPDPDLLRWVLRRLVEVSVDAATLVQIDDADRVGAGFVRLLSDVTTAARDAPLLIVLTSTGDADGVPTMRVAPLGPDDAAMLVGKLLGAAEPGVAAAVAARAGGNPFAIEQALALLTETGTLAPGQGRWMPLADLAQVPMPDTPIALIRQRLQTLPAQELAVIGMAAVAGERFAAEPLLDVLPPEARAGAPAHLADLVARGYLLIETPTDLPLPASAARPGDPRRGARLGAGDGARARRARSRAGRRRPPLASRRRGGRSPRGQLPAPAGHGAGRAQRRARDAGVVGVRGGRARRSRRGRAAGATGRGAARSRPRSPRRAALPGGRARLGRGARTPGRSRDRRGRPCVLGCRRRRRLARPAAARPPPDDGRPRRCSRGRPGDRRRSDRGLRRGRPRVGVVQGVGPSRPRAHGARAERDGRRRPDEGRRQRGGRRTVARGDVGASGRGGGAPRRPRARRGSGGALHLLPAPRSRTVGRARHPRRVGAPAGASFRVRHRALGHHRVDRGARGAGRLRRPCRGAVPGGADRDPHRTAGRRRATDATGARRGGARARRRASRGVGGLVRAHPDQRRGTARRGAGAGRRRRGARARHHHAGGMAHGSGPRDGATRPRRARRTPGARSAEPCRADGLHRAPRHRAVGRGRRPAPGRASVRGRAVREASAPAVRATRGDRPGSGDRRAGRC